MAQEREGTAFLRHEFDEAIVVQRAILETEQQLAKDHPLGGAKQALDSMLEPDQTQLRELERLGKRFGATGEKEEVATALEKLATETMEGANGGPDSEMYEATAVLLTLKRKQQDAATAMRAIADELGDDELIRACGELERESRAGGEQLSRVQSELAVELATRGDGGQSH